MGKKKNAAAAALAAVAAAGMVTNAVVDQPADLLTDTPFAVEEQEDEEDTAAEQKRSGPAARVRNWVLAWPPAVRMLVAVPLWCLGWVLMTGLSTFWAGAATPLASRLLGWLCLAVILLAVYALSVKAAFPKARFRRLLRPRNVCFLLGLTALLAVADLALPTVWEGYDQIARLVWRVGATGLLAVSCGAELKRQGRREQKRFAAPVRTAVEEEALRLADAVCPPRH